MSVPDVMETKISRTYLIDECRSKTVADAGTRLQATENFLPVAKEKKTFRES